MCEAITNEMQAVERYFYYGHERTLRVPVMTEIKSFL